MEPILVRENIESYAMLNFEGDIDNVIKFLTELRQQYGPGLTLEFTTGWSDDDQCIEVYLYRPETETEMKARLAREAAAARFREEMDRKQYEILKQRYGKE